MNLNLVFLKSMNLNLIFSKSMNLNLKIKKKMKGSNPVLDSTSAAKRFHIFLVITIRIHFSVNAMSEI